MPTICQEIFKTAEEDQKVENKLTLIQLREELEKEVEETDNDYSKRKFKLTPQEIKRLQQEGITQKQIARSFEVSERTVRNREKKKL